MTMYFLKRLFIAVLAYIALELGLVYVIAFTLTHVIHAEGFGIAFVSRWAGLLPFMVLFLVFVVLPAWAAARISGRLVKKAPPAGGTSLL
jgi:hypothetical protein